MHILLYQILQFSIHDDSKYPVNSSGIEKL